MRNIIIYLVNLKYFKPSWVLKTGDKEWELKVSELTQGKGERRGWKNYNLPK